MTLLPDDLCLLLEQMNLHHPSSPSSGTSSPSEESPPQPSQESMTTLQRLRKLVEMRTSMQQQLILLLVKAGNTQDTGREQVEAEVEEYKDLLDGMDLLIQRLQQQRRARQERELEEWREMDEV
jgi:soluble cytochrome b562